MGIAWNVGDELTYYVETNNKDKRTNRHIVLARSAVVPDNGQNSRANTSRDINPIHSGEYDVWDSDEESSLDEDTVHYNSAEENLAEDDLEETEDPDDKFNLVAIEGHKTKGKSKTPLVFCRWKNRNTSWEKLVHIKIDFPIMLANYIVKNNCNKLFKPT